MKAKQSDITRYLSPSKNILQILKDEHCGASSPSTFASKKRNLEGDEHNTNKKRKISEMETLNKSKKSKTTNSLSPAPSPLKGNKNQKDIFEAFKKLETKSKDDLKQQLEHEQEQGNLLKEMRNEQEEMKGQTQSVLDLGQSQWQTQCLHCGLFYSIGNEEDEKVHLKYHKAKLAPIAYNGFKNECKVSEWGDGSYVVVFTANDPLIKRPKIQQIKENIDQVINFAYSKNWQPENEKIYLYIKSKKIVGCVIVESIKVGFAVEALNSNTLPATDTTPPTKTPYCTTVSSSPSPAQMGVSRIWVHPLHRKQGIASKLLDVARSDYVYGMSIAKNLVAVTQPTPDGLELFSKYLGPSFLIYRC